MSSTKLEILYEDNHLLALNKPPGLATMGVPGDEVSLLDLAKRHIKQQYQKPGNVYLGVVSRLDALASGVVVFARTSKAAARLTEQFRSRQVEKTYWAIVAGNLAPAEGELVNWVIKDDARQRMIVVSETTPGAKQAQLRYRIIDRVGQYSRVEVELITGRKHQIRVQFARRGQPILGDRKYGSTADFGAGIALHSRKLVLEHPTKHEPIRLQASVPISWRRLGVTD